MNGNKSGIEIVKGDDSRKMRRKRRIKSRIVRSNLIIAEIMKSLDKLEPPYLRQNMETRMSKGMIETIMTSKGNTLNIDIGGYATLK